MSRESSNNAQYRRRNETRWFIASRRAELGDDAGYNAYALVQVDVLDRCFEQ